MAILKEQEGIIKKKLTLAPLSETEPVDNNVPTKPLQSGNPMVSHTVRESKTLEVVGRLYAKNPSGGKNYQYELDTIYGYLLTWQFDGTLLEYSGKSRLQNVVISNLSKVYTEENYTNLIDVSFTLQEISIPVLGFDGAENLGRVEPTENNGGTYVTVKPGDTYWGYAIAYGTSVDEIRNLSGHENQTMYPPYGIDGNGKVRVK